MTIPAISKTGVMKRLFNIYIGLAFFLAAPTLQGQAPEAKSSYNQLSYQKAIAKYKRLIAKDANNGEAIFNLANSYRLNEETALAEQWFAQAVEKDGRPDAILYYGQALMTNGKYQTAKDQFLHYASLASLSSDQVTARKLANKCEDIIANGIRPGDYLVKPVPFNSEALDFSPTYLGKNQLAFASNRKPGKTKLGEKDPWTDDQFVDMYQVDVMGNGKAFGVPTPLPGKLNGNYHEGPMAFSEDGQRIFFTRNDYRRKRGFDDEKNTRLKIYEGELVEDEWEIKRELSFNDSEYSCAHPTLSRDGKWLLFSSDRPGGFGGMDLYASQWSGSEWSAPINLGSGINSSGTDVFPYLGDDNTLYYSSDFKPGIGGLDVYSSKWEDSWWGQVENMGAPINSPRDDFGFIINPQGSEGYFSSNRAGKKDDIYHFLAAPGKPLRGRVVLCHTDRPIPSIDVLVEGQRFADLELITDENGVFTFSAPEGSSLLATASGEGYITTDACPGKESFSTNEDVEIVLALIEDPSLIGDGIRTIGGQITNSDYGTPLANTKIRIINRCTGEVYETTTDSKGNYKAPAPEECDYVLQVEKPNFKPQIIPVSTMGKPGDEPISQSVQMVFDDDAIPGLLGEGTLLAPGLLIELEHIYFDYDKYFIRPDAIPELMELLQLLRKYPSMQGEIRAHTDSRAPIEYNNTLSANRASTARDWLVMNGISVNRISFRGYGESQLRNRCGNDINCTEFEHQRNRRVEFMVTSLDGKQLDSKEATQYRAKKR